MAAVTERPQLSIVVPAYNEEAVIGRFVESVHAEVSPLGVTWEILVVDDGSADATAAIVRDAAVRDVARGDNRVRLLETAHRGKGAAVREGFLAARGEWVLMADADLSMPWDNLRRFLDVAAENPAPHIIIGSREAPGAQRTGEARSRRISGRVFNALVRLFAVRGIHDTQCGYKLLSAEAAAALAPHLTIDGFAFDVELLYLARLAGFPIREVGIVCHCRQDSRVRVRLGIEAVVDVLRVRLRTRATSYSALQDLPGPASSRDRRRDSSCTPSRPYR
jgi:dolichyl-phosphate beta-glucosyltransferase